MTDEEWNELGSAVLSPNGNSISVAKADIPDKNNIPDKNVEHPAHYGGADNPYEVINIIEAYGLNFVEGNILKYLLRYKNKNGIECLKKAQWYLERLIKQQQK